MPQPDAIVAAFEEALRRLPPDEASAFADEILRALAAKADEMLGRKPWDDAADHRFDRPMRMPGGLYED